mmetsp:Transcript_23914/g.49380  ORF Transcript_23914/g.49380 Transcript_23914/m.49380 type:complete len:217 (-) Transcript_23914:120-770(-)
MLPPMFPLVIRWQLAASTITRTRRSSTRKSAPQMHRLLKTRDASVALPSNAPESAPRVKLSTIPASNSRSVEPRQLAATSIVRTRTRSTRRFVRRMPSTLALRDATVLVNTQMIRKLIALPVAPLLSARSSMLFGPCLSERWQFYLPLLFREFNEYGVCMRVRTRWHRLIFYELVEEKNNRSNIRNRKMSGAAAEPLERPTLTRQADECNESVVLF